MLSIVQAFATLVAGIIIGLIYIWKVGLVGLGSFSYTPQGHVFIDADRLI